MDGRKNMNKYDKMLASNKKASEAKIELAQKIMLEMMDKGVKVTVTRLMEKTGLSRGFFYKNPEIRKMFNEVQEKQGGLTEVRRGILDLAMDNEIEMLNEKIRVLQRENESLKFEIQRLKQMAERKAMSNFKKL